MGQSKPYKNASQKLLKYQSRFLGTPSLPVLSLIISMGCADEGLSSNSLSLEPVTEAEGGDTSPTPFKISKSNEKKVVGQLKKKVLKEKFPIKRKNSKSKSGDNADLDTNAVKVVIVDCDNADAVLKAMQQFSGLESLDVQNSSLKNGFMQHIAKLPLKRLNLRGLHIAGKDMSPIARMKALEELYIGQNNLGGNKTLTDILGLENLERLDLSSNNVDPSFLSQLSKMPSLKELALDHNTRVNMDALAQLKDLPLEILYVRDTGIASEDIAEIAKQFKSLKALHLGIIYINRQDLELAKKVNPDLHISADFARIK